ncbi:MAG: eukaryotic-like serine/threonine-protein kinase [Bryobacterales bacterium]|nr:eukaryotic-like serine/threonine-protein kinase [Bryobacterales bacterium]
MWHAFFGYAPEARRRAIAALELSGGRDVEYAAAFALARLGDLSQPRTLTADLERRFPENTSVRFSYLPVLRASSALNEDEPQKAIELLQIATPYELAVPAIGFYANFGGFYPAYVRGMAYLAKSADSDIPILKQAKVEYARLRLTLHQDLRAVLATRVPKPS